MNVARSIFVVLAVVVAGSAWAYQVTGPVTALTDDAITVQKGKDLWEIARTPDAKVTGDLKVGSKVTIEYKMTATKIDVKEAGKAPAKKK